MVETWLWLKMVVLPHSHVCLTHVHTYLAAVAALTALTAFAALIEGDEPLFISGQIVMALRWKGTIRPNRPAGRSCLGSLDSALRSNGINHLTSSHQKRYIGILP